MLATDRRDRLRSRLQQRCRRAASSRRYGRHPNRNNAPDKERPMRRQGQDGRRAITSSLPTTSSPKSSAAPRRGRNTGSPVKTGCLRTSPPGARYQGGNALQLMVKRTQRAYNDNRWGTYKQIKEAKGQVRKGERGTTVLVYKPARAHRPQGSHLGATSGRRQKLEGSGCREDHAADVAALHRVQRRASRGPRSSPNGRGRGPNGRR